MKKSKLILITLFVLLATALSVAIILIPNYHLLGAKVRKIISQSDIEPKYRWNSLTVYETDSRYIVTIGENSVGTKGFGAEFSKGRKCLAYYGIVPIKNIETQKFENKDFSWVERRLGKYHIDIGSGFFIPAYITDDGYLICFHVEKDRVTSIQKFDLFTCEKIYDSRS